MCGISLTYSNLFSQNDTTVGYNEVYLTNADGTLTKVYNNGLDGSGSKTLRPVSITNVKGAKGDMVFIATNGKTRQDGKTNSHQMFLNGYTTAAAKPYFKEVTGPYKRNFTASCAYAADISKNGVDDLIVCQPKGLAQMYLQKVDGNWVQQALPNSKYTTGWRIVRVKEMNRDKFDDIVIVSVNKGKYWLRVFKGKAAKPYFNFTAPFYEKSFPYGTFIYAHRIRFAFSFAFAHTPILRRLKQQPLRVWRSLTTMATAVGTFT